MPKRKVDKRDIISSAYRLFTSQGFAKTSMADIASACGLLKGSIYYYFESKEALIESVLQSSLAYKSLGLLPIAYNDRIPSKERLERFLSSIDSNQILELQGSLMIAAVLELGANQTYQQYLSKFFDDWIQAVGLVISSGPENEGAKLQAEQILEQLMGAITLTLTFRTTRYLDKCVEDLTKQTFGK